MVCLWSKPQDRKCLMFKCRLWSVQRQQVEKKQAWNQQEEEAEEEKVGRGGNHSWCLTHGYCLLSLCFSNTKVYNGFGGWRVSNWTSESSLKPEHELIQWFVFIEKNTQRDVFKFLILSRSKKKKLKFEVFRNRKQRKYFDSNKRSNLPAGWILVTWNKVVPWGACAASKSDKRRAKCCRIGHGIDIKT